MAFFLQISVFPLLCFSFAFTLLTGPKGRVVIDVGTNTGLDWAIPGVSKGKHVVYAFEPNPAMVTKIVRNARTAKIPFTLIEHCNDAATIRDAVSKVKVDKSIGHLFLFPAAAGDAYGEITIMSTVPPACK